MNDAYSRTHSDRRNLAVHLVTVPLAWLGLASVVAGLYARSPLVAAAGAVLFVAALGAQGGGHALEREKFRFRGPLHFVVVMVREQLVGFPRFLLTGGFLRTWRRAVTAAGGKPAAPPA